jgi:hypothetical protein
MLLSRCFDSLRRNTKIANPPPNPFRVVTVQPVTDDELEERRKNRITIEDHAGPTTQVMPWQTQPAISGTDRRPTKEILKQAMEEVLDIDMARKLMATALNLALSGNIDYLKLLWERMEGKVVSKSESGRPGEFADLEEALDSINLEDARKIKEMARKDTA